MRVDELRDQLATLPGDAEVGVAVNAYTYALVKRVVHTEDDGQVELVLGRKQAEH